MPNPEIALNLESDLTRKACGIKGYGQINFLSDLGDGGSGVMEGKDTSVYKH